MVSTVFSFEKCTLKNKKKERENTASKRKTDKHGFLPEPSLYYTLVLVGKGNSVEGSFNYESKRKNQCGRVLIQEVAQTYFFVRLINESDINLKFNE